MSRTVRTTFRPDLEIEVDDIEYRQLKAEGLLVADTPATSAPAPAAAPAVPATPSKKTAGPAGSKES